MWSTSVGYRPGSRHLRLRRKVGNGTRSGRFRCALGAVSQHLTESFQLKMRNSGAFDGPMSERNTTTNCIGDLRCAVLQLSGLGLLRWLRSQARHMRPICRRGSMPRRLLWLHQSIIGVASISASTVAAHPVTIAGPAAFRCRPDWVATMRREAWPVARSVIAGKRRIGCSG